MVLCETGRLQLFRVIRGGLRVSEETPPPRRRPGLTATRRLSLEPKRRPHRGLQARGKPHSPVGSGPTLKQLALSDAQR
jgi:hypothetical protein